MPVDQTVLSQLDTGHARAIASSQNFFDHHAMMISAQANEDGRRMGGFLASQLFTQNTQEEKTALLSPVSPATVAAAVKGA